MQKKLVFMMLIIYNGIEDLHKKDWLGYCK